MKDKLKPFLPHLAAIAIFLVISVIYFLPAFQGMRLVQGDMKNTAGMVQESKFSHQETDGYSAWSGSMFCGMPIYQIWNYTDFDGGMVSYLHYGLLGLLPQPASIWFLYAVGFYILMVALRIRSSVAILGALAFAFSSYLIIILEVGHITKALAVAYSPIVLAGLVWLYRGRYGLGSIVTSLGMALAVGANHPQVTYYFGLLFIIFGIGQLFVAIKEKQIKTFVFASILTVVSFGIGVLCNFASLYSTYEYGKFTTRGQSELTIKSDGSSNKDISTSGLDKDYITAWSYGLGESWTLLFPNAKGGATGAIGMDNKALDKADPQFRDNIGQGANHYWGDQSFTEGPVYAGAIVCLLFVLGMIFLDGALKWVMLAGALLSLGLSWGKNFMPLTDFFLDYAPGYNKFRAVTIVLVVIELCLPVVAILFINDLIQKRTEWLQKKKLMLIGGGAVVGLLLLFWIAPGSFFSFVSEAETEGLNQQVAKSPEMASTIQGYINSLKEVRMAIFKADVFRSLMFVIVAFALVYAYLLKGFKSTIFVLGMGFLLLADQFTVDRRYLNTEKNNGRYVQWEEPTNNEYPYMPTAADMEILKRELSGANSLQISMPESLLVKSEGFLKPQEIVKEINEKVEKRKAEKLSEGKGNTVSDAELATIQFGTLNLNSNYRVFNLNVSPFNDASTSYFHKSIGGYHGAKLKRYQELIEFHLSNPITPGVLNMLNAKYVITQQGLQQNPGALGNVWFVNTIKKVKNADEEITALKDFDPKTTVIVDQRYAGLLKPVTADSTASIKETSYSLAKLTYESNSSSEQLAVFSEIYYQDWKAYIDGKRVEYFRCNYVLRGLMIPAGKHTIEFKCEPDMMKTGKMGSYTGSTLLALVILLGIFFEWRKKKNTRIDG